ncbi:ABC transporter integral membrane type 1 [Penicillium expansum]|nr:ABC transporter integral membrane type 1 [Penicillium expansum]
MPFSSQYGSLFEQNSEQFDFNIDFEQVFFAIIPSALFIIPALWRTISLSRRPIVVNASVFRLVKVGAITAYAALQLALVVLAAAGHFHATAMFMATSVIKLLAAVAMLPLSVVEHSRTPRPSMLLMSYLILTLLLDAAQSRTLYLSLSSAVSTERAYSNLFTAAVAVKVVVLLLESQHKSRWVHWDKKEHSPEETSGIFSLGVFFWLNRLFLTGYNKVLSINDLYPLDGAMDPTRLHEKFSRHLDIPKMKGDKYGLTKVLMRTLIGPLLLPTIPRLALLGFSFAQPLFIEGLLNYLSGNMLNENVGYGFIGASFFIYSGIVVSWAFHRYYHHRMRTMLRSILVTETFITATNARIGNDDSAALTLMSTDIERIRMGFRQLHDVWASLIQVALCAWMLDRRLGVVFVAPIVVVLLCFLSLAILMKFIGTAQRRWMSLVQKRVGLTATVIASMKNLKISGLSSSVSTFVQKLRVEELTAGVRYRKIYIGAALLGFIPLLISPALTFAFTQSRLDSSKVFTNLSFLTLMTQPLSQIFQTIPEVISGLACISRIQAFMECETREDFRKVAISFEKHSEKDSLSSQPSPESEVVIENGSFGWEQDKFVLQDINAKIPNSSLTLVVGPVGSGKSTLCKALLGEIPFHQGKVTLRTHASASFVGFCDQTAFVLNGTIKENIIGFSPVNEDRYAEVIEATSLAFDFDTLAQGDETNVGSDGISLSGGQKQRISLARALYLQAHFLILDDVFSGLDADTEEQVFRKVFGPAGLLRRRQTTVLLCTHSVRHLQAADHVIALGGDGGISEQGTFDALMAGNGYVHRVGLKGLSESKTTSEESSIENSAQESSSPAEKIKAAKLIITPNMDASRKVGDGTVYKQYMKSMGRLLAGSAILFASLWGFFLNFSTICKYSMSLNTVCIPKEGLTYWVNDIQLQRPAHSSAYWAGIYALFQISALISLFLLGASIWIVSIKRAGANLHEDILKTLFRAPLRFFTETDIGVTTNLFSQDLNLIDTELPDATVSTLFSITQVIGQMAVMLTAAPYLAVTFPFLAALLYVLQKFYLRTSRQLRLLDLEAKSPLYTHFLDIVRGITTLRAFGFIREDIHKNARLLTSSQRPSYLLLMIQEWLNVVLDVVVMLLAVGLTTFAVRFHSNSSFTGAALYSLLSFGENLTGIVLFWTKLETSLGAIARLKTFTETVEPEDRDGEDIDAPEQWPQRGVVELKGVSAKYATEDQNDEATSLALRNIQLTINSGEKIAICGRTGSGKSSLVALLLKLLDPIATTAENIVIDDLPLHRLNRSVLRQRIIAVPQEAVFLPDGSTVQNNLDVSEEATPEECKTVLKSVGLWEFVKERGGLAAGMNSSSFSNGQRQLLSFGRALLRRSVRERKFGAAVQLGGILLLDEVSSSVDQETERIMQETIRTEFKNYTVIAVSHRLDMVMDFDRVVVMDTGEIVEVGKPAVLAREAGTRFGDLVRAGNK